MTDIYDDYFEQAKDIEEFTKDEHKSFKEKVKQILGSESPEPEEPEKDECAHSETTIVNNGEVCSSCGVVIQQDISSEKDIRYTGLCDTKSSKDPTRCHKRKSDQRNIYKDVEGMGFPESIVKIANKKYQEIIKDAIYRGAKRKAIIVSCIYYSYMDQSEHRTSDEISKKFNIKKKSLKEGFSKYCECFPEATIKYVSPVDLVRQIMIRANIHFSHFQKIARLCEFLENKSPLLNRSNPQSVASSIVYLYLCLEPEYKEKLEMTKAKFAEIVELSDITITKLGKEAQRVIQNDSIKI